ncbi:MAG: ATP-dependent helicase, partial [Deltaproteobacteria bacterium]
MKKYVLQTEPAASAARFEKELNPQQLEAACAPHGQVLIVAGAGSGKTRTLIYRLLYLLDSGVHPSAMALCTFTRKAAKQMLERAARHEPELARQVWGGTFHHLANRILRRHCERLGYRPDYTILDSTDAGELLGECLTAVESSLKGRGILPRPRVLQHLIGLSVATMTPLEKVVLKSNKRLAGQLELLLKVARMYDRRKREMNLMDFDDLLWRLRELVLPESPVAEEIAARFQHVLVDEYQDTNPLQAYIVDRLAAVHENLTVVGDDAQSIYGFRGASAESMLTFTQRWPEAMVYRLELNYRSIPPILNAANLCISNNRQQLEKTL